jgi:hypothetical protein
MPHTTQARVLPNAAKRRNCRQIAVRRSITKRPYAFTNLDQMSLLQQDAVN